MVIAPWFGIEDVVGIVIPRDGLTREHAARILIHPWREARFLADAGHVRRFGNGGASMLCRVLAGVCRFQALLAVATCLALLGCRTPRSGHMMAPMGPAAVLVAGGWDGVQVLSSSHVYRAMTGQWVAAAPMTERRNLAVTAQLFGGRVLVAGGRTHLGTGEELATAEVYDPASGLWNPVGSMANGRALATATLLPSGFVLVTGGEAGPHWVASAELFDPDTSTWLPAGSMSIGRSNHTATLLASGDVLVAGGLVAGRSLASAELFDPDARTWSAAGPMSTARDTHTATLLPSGKVLVAGGYVADQSVVDVVGVSATGAADLFDPTTRVWSTTGSMRSPRFSHTATLLASGSVLVTGGSDGITNLSSAEIYDPATESWTPTGSLTSRRAGHRAVRLESGLVLVVGGFDGRVFLSTAELYDPVDGTWRTAGAM